MSGFTNLAELLKVVNLIEPADHQAAGIDGDSINLGLIHQALIVITFGALTADSILTVNTGATEGTKTTAETFRYRLAGADLGTDGSDNFGAWATSAALTLTAATYDHRIVEVEVNSDEFTAAQPWLTINIDATATALFVGAVAVCRSRFASGGGAPTVL